MIVRSMSVVRLLMVSALLLLHLPVALAKVTCTAVTGMTLNLPATITAPRDRSLGTPLTSWITVGSVVTENGCTYNDASTVYTQARAILTPTGKRVTDGGVSYAVFSTSVSGVGLILSIKDAGGAWMAAEATTMDLLKAAVTSYGTFASGRLVATGDAISTGVLPAMTVGEQFITEKSSGSSTTPKAAIKITSTSITAQTCSVDAGSVNIPVNLAITSSSKLQGPVGTTDGNASFNVRLNCNTGVNVFMTLSDANNLGNTSDTLTLSPSLVQAKGVGIQIRRNGSPVRFGPDSSAAGNTNQISVGASPNGVLTIPFTANYIKTATTVRPGEANAVATYTLSYQ
ncbi:fimbrial protein [Pseudomonas sp. SCB32]|uniref:fimbrial protein n=1 Tax=Pseudomonas sp. SCB32 TaxID=2653853 RepID=UPI0012653ABD|nr:fimbrial protein [Pseudomonas sp. SCB32]